MDQSKSINSIFESCILNLVVFKKQIFNHLDEKTDKFRKGQLGRTSPVCNLYDWNEIRSYPHPHRYQHFLRELQESVANEN